MNTPEWVLSTMSKLSSLMRSASLPRGTLLYSPSYNGRVEAADVIAAGGHDRPPPHAGCLGATFVMRSTGPGSGLDCLFPDEGRRVRRWGPLRLSDKIQSAAL